MTLPAAGWFPDPQDAQRLRWWDGRTWGSATQPAPRSTSASTEHGPAEVAVAPQFSVGVTRVATAAWAYGSGVGAVATASAIAGSAVAGSAIGQQIGQQQGSAVQQVEARRFCVFGWSSIAVALVSAVVNPLGMLSLLAIALAVVGFVRPRGTGTWRIVGRSLSASAVVIAIATGLVFADAFATLLRSYAGL